MAGKVKNQAIYDALHESWPVGTTKTIDSAIEDATKRCKGLEFSRYQVSTMFDNWIERGCIEDAGKLSNNRTRVFLKLCNPEDSRSNRLERNQLSEAMAILPDWLLPKPPFGRKCRGRITTVMYV